MISISIQLEVLAGDKLYVPGNEPTSELTSPALGRALKNNKAIVSLAAALAAIPGSYVKYGDNYGLGNTRKKWFVLPPRNNNCPCEPYDDYFRILKDLAAEETPITESFSYCDIIGQGFCPSPNFRDTPAPPQDPYIPEGTVRNTLFPGLG